MSSVVVVGGGYGGTLAAKELDSEADVTLIDPREAFVNAAASLRALTQPDWAHHAFFPFETLLERGRVIRDRAVSVDPKGVTLASGERVEADHLVLATGSSYSYPAKPNPASTSIAQQLDDLRATHKELAGAGRVLILGAGPVGLELAGEIKEVWPGKDVVIVDRGDQLLPGFLPEVRDDLRRPPSTRRRPSGGFCFRSERMRVSVSSRRPARSPLPPRRRSMNARAPTCSPHGSKTGSAGRDRDVVEGGVAGGGGGLQADVAGRRL